VLKSIAELPDEPDRDIGVYCEEPYDCGYTGYCWRHIPKHSVFAVAGMKKALKYNLYYAGVVSFEQLLERGAAHLNKKMRQQVEIEAEKKPPHIDKRKVSDFLDGLSFPLCFLDFETFQQAVPEYDGVSPYTRIPFQYSLHILPEENAEVIHKGFLAKEGTDPRRAFAESLCAEVPRDACVLVFNKGFEGSVLRESAELFPDLSARLCGINDHIADMMALFRNRAYYSREMEGSYSIKKVLPALCPGDPNLDYKALESIQKGSDAMNAFPNLHLKPREEIRKTREALLAYCRLDTLAMVKIYEKLRDVTADDA
jgi:hypothetical protein